MQWLALENPSAANAETLVILSNLKFVATQNQQLLRCCEIIIDNRYVRIEGHHPRPTPYPSPSIYTNSINLSRRTGSRRSSVSSGAASTATGGDGEDEGDTSRVSVADDAVVTSSYDFVTESPGIDILTDIYVPWTTVHRKKLYKQRTIPCTKDAVAFFDHTITVVQKSNETENKVEHDQLLTSIGNLTTDLKTNVYILLCKAKLATEKAAQPKGKAKAKGKTKVQGKAVEKTTSPQDEVTKPKEATVTDPDPDGKGKGKGKGKPKERLQSPAGKEESLFVSSSPRRSARIIRSRENSVLPPRQISRSSQVEPESQASMTSIEARRSRQKTRFVIEDSDEDEE